MKSKTIEEVFATTVTSDPGEPETIDQALSGPESVQWNESMKDEVKNFLKRKAWKAVPIERVKEEGRKLVKTEAVFEKKDEQDGTTRHKSRLCTKGFAMIPDQDCKESFSPVAADISI